MLENQRDRQQLIDEEVDVIVRTWDDQQRMRHGILSKLDELARRVSIQRGPLAPSGGESRGGS